MLLKEVIRPIIERINTYPQTMGDLLKPVGNTIASNESVYDALNKLYDIVEKTWDSAPNNAQMNKRYDDILSDINVAITHINENIDNPSAWKNIRLTE